MDYEALRPERVVHVGLDGEVLAPASGADAPSSEWRMHTDIYRYCPDAGAVVHAHPPNATALACTGRGIPAFHYMVAVAGGSDIRCAPYATFGTADLSRNMMTAMEDRRACLLANHGMICYGTDLAAALAPAVEVEALARQYVIALGPGDVGILDETQMAEVLERFKTYGRLQPGPADRS
ncbi:MAG: class II aldolase/adducin family protein [Gammaproteobacteria bacterium]|nr:class II aldolase/adducin family protein [Gammaproteobacteria bacterium]